MSERRRAPIEVLERLAEAYDYAQDPLGSSKRETRLEDAYRAYRAATAPLRTRAEVDAELVAWVRDSVTSKRHINPTWDLVLRLCSEPTADEPEPNASTDHDADLRDPEPCSCEETEALKKLLQRVFCRALYYREGEAISALSIIREMTKEYAD